MKLFGAKKRFCNRRPKQTQNHIKRGVNTFLLPYQKSFVLSMDRCKECNSMERLIGRICEDCLIREGGYVSER